MKFEYKLTGVGWAGGLLEINGQKSVFEVSYLCSPLFKLLGTLVNMIPAKHYDIDLKDFEFVWYGEPWGYKWEFKEKKNNIINIKVTFYQDTDDIELKKNKLKGEVRINIDCDRDEFIKLVVKTCEEILAEFGILGYDQSWYSMHDYFPISFFLILKDHIGKKKYYKMKRKGDVVYSDYKYELNLLSIKTK